VRRVVHLAGRVPHHFLRHATDVNAGAAEPPGLNDGHAGAVFRGAARMRDTTAAATDDDKIEFIVQTSFLAEFFARRGGLLFV
jgi:hypothetical protein